MEKDIYMSVSRKARALLNGQEGFDVDFKMSVRGIDATDLVAFANSDRGGTILAGIAESEDNNSMQRGKIIGCAVGDKERLHLLSKSESCVPPIEINIIVENYARKPFYRIEIPSGREKPYCTSGGTYKIRGDGRTNTLLPGRLLSLFVEKQSEIFFNRFREATKELGKDMVDSSFNSTVIQDDLYTILVKILNMEYLVESRLENIQKELSQAEAITGENKCNFDAILNSVNKLKDRIKRLEKAMGSIDARINSIVE